MLRPKDLIQISVKIPNLLQEKDLISIGSCGSILYREFEFTSLRQRVFLSSILELFSLQIPAFGRIVAILLESENRFMRISRFRNANFLCAIIVNTGDLQHEGLFGGQSAFLYWDSNQAAFFAAFFCAAQRFRCASAIRLRASGLRVRFWLALPCKRHPTTEHGLVEGV
jgi:hypothetical protein